MGRKATREAGQAASRGTHPAHRLCEHPVDTADYGTHCQLTGVFTVRPLSLMASRDACSS